MGIALCEGRLPVGRTASVAPRASSDEPAGRSDLNCPIYANLLPRSRIVPVETVHSIAHKTRKRAVHG